MAIISNTINYLDDETLLEGFFAYDDSSKERKPAILIAHAWGGRNQFVEDKAIELAKLGYVAFALDMYGAGKTGNSIEENSRLMQPFIDDRACLQKRMNAALYAVKLLPWVDDKNIAAIGFCFGGLCVLDLARSGADIKGVVSFHGLLKPPTAQQIDQKTITAKMLILHGHEDPLTNPEELTHFYQEMNTKHVDWQLNHYSHTQHAFTNPDANDINLGLVYHPVNSERAWLAMKNFLTELF